MKKVLQWHFFLNKKKLYSPRGFRNWYDGKELGSTFIVKRKFLVSITYCNPLIIPSFSIICTSSLLRIWKDNFSSLAHISIHGRVCMKKELIQTSSVRPLSNRHGRWFQLLGYHGARKESHAIENSSRMKDDYRWIAAWLRKYLFCSIQTST